MPKKRDCKLIRSFLPWLINLIPYRFRPSTGVFVIIQNGGGRFLIVKHRYGLRRWSLPGGGPEYKELLTDTGRREVREETGLIVGIDEQIGIFTLRLSFGHVVLFRGHVADGKLKPDEKETSDCGFYSLEELQTMPVYKAQLSLILWSQIHKPGSPPFYGYLTLPPSSKLV